MADENEIRPGESAVPWTDKVDAGLVFIGRIHTPWTSRSECPRQGQPDGPLCRITFFEIWSEALEGVARYTHFEVIYWLHLSRRDLVRQCARHDNVPRGTFSLSGAILA